MAAHPLTRILRVGRRLGWGIGDQALSSLTNFGLGIMVARTVSPADFGAFGVAFATYLLVLGVGRSCGGEPMVVRYSARSAEDWRRGARAATGTATAVGIIAGVGCLLASPLTSGPLTGSLVALAVVLPGLLAQDAWRYAFFAANRGSGAFLNDLVWTGALVPGIGIAIALRLDSAAGLIFAWGAAANVAALFGCLQTRALPSPSSIKGWFRTHRDLIPRFLTEFLAFNGSTQLMIYGLGLVVGLSAVGSLRAAEILLGPLSVLALGVNLIAVPEGVRALNESVHKLWVMCMIFGGIVASTAIVWGVIAALLPESIGHALVGESWAGADKIVLFIAISRAGTGLGAAAASGLRAFGAARRSLRARLIVSPIVITAGIGGAIVGGIEGASLGLAIAGAIDGCIWWWQLAKEARAQRAASEVT